MTILDRLWANLARMRFGKRRVYISSTYLDLSEFRTVVQSTLEKAGYDIEGMEKYPAFEERPVAKCLRDVSRCDLFVLIIARRYGFVPPDEQHGGRSIVHLEYGRALKARKPCFVFVLDESIPWEDAYTDLDYRKSDSGIASFRSAVMRRHGVATFSTPHNLATSALQALHAFELEGRSRRRSAVAAGLLVSFVGIWVVFSIDDETPLSSPEWLNVVSTSQEAKLAALHRSGGDNRQLQREVEYLGRLTSDVEAWDRFVDAYRWMRTALKNPRDGAASEREVREALATGRMEPIIQSLSSAVLAKDQEPRRHYALGVFHEASGNFDAAFESFRRAVDLQPDETEFVTATLNLSLNLGLFVDALATLEVQIKAAERSGKTDVLAKYWGYKGLALWHVGSSDEARRSFDRALELAKQPEVRARMFNDRVPLFNEKGDFAGAEKTLTSAAVLYRCSLGAANKKTITVLNNLNAALVRQGKLRQADSHLEYVKSLFASDEYLRDPYPVLRVQHAVTRSMMLYERGKFLESAQELRSVQRMLAELHLQNSFLYARATLYLGRSLERAGDSAEAVVQLESSLGLNLHLFGSGHVETINNRVFLGSAYLHAQQSEKASIESRQAELFVAGNPQGQYRFIPRLQALRAELAVLGIADSLQNQDGFSIWETACEAQGIQRDGYVDGAECWRRLSTVGSRLGHAKQEHYATQLALAVRRPALTDQELALVWDIPCTKVVD